MATALPLNYALVIYHGTTFTRQFRWRPDGTTPQDFTGWTAEMWISSPGFTLGYDLSTDPGEGLTLDDQGQVTISMSAADTAELKPGVYRYNLDLTDAGGTVIRFLRGRVDVVGDAEPMP